MSGLYVKCDRCDELAELTEWEDLVQMYPVPPGGWRRVVGPVRGSQGAKSDRSYLLCDQCDDALYEWLTEDPS